MTDTNMLVVTMAEDGMKLLAFLDRRLEKKVPASDLHRWVRSGQVRVNGGRVKPFVRLATGDIIRLPPFAAPEQRNDIPPPDPLTGELLTEGLRVLAVTPDFLVLEKAPGVSVQPGSKQSTSVSDILRQRFAGAAYVPAPAHRIDKQTSGLLLAGRTHQAQARLHAMFGTAANGVDKTYLAWVKGRWPDKGLSRLEDLITKETVPGPDGRPTERMVATNPKPGGSDAESGLAVSRASLVETRLVHGQDVSLLRVLLQTGRTHQIRVQLSSRGFPIIGDLKYGGPRHGRMLLHAHSLAFGWDGTEMCFVSWPDWDAPFGLRT